MKGTPAEGRVHAKTGSIAYVRALSGYVQTADDEWMQFVILANNFAGKVTTADVDRITEQAVNCLGLGRAPASTLRWKAALTDLAPRRYRYHVVFRGRSAVESGLFLLDRFLCWCELRGWIYFTG